MAIITNNGISSSPEAASDTYGLGETVEFFVEYDIPVDVVGPIQCPMNFGQSPSGSPEYADYAGGTGTNRLTFERVIVATDEDTNGIFIYGSSSTFNSLNLNGGTIKDAGTDIDADLILVVSGTQSEHKVDGSLNVNRDAGASLSSGPGVVTAAADTQTVTVTNRDVAASLSTGAPSVEATADIEPAISGTLAQQTFDLGIPIFFIAGDRAIWQAQAGNEVDGIYVAGGGSGVDLTSVTVRQNTRLQITLSGGSGEFSNEAEASPDFVIFESGGNTLTVDGPNHPDSVLGDPTEPYQWIPQNDSAVTAFFNTLDASSELRLTLSIEVFATNRDGAVTLSSGSPAVGVAADAQVVVNRDGGVSLSSDDPSLSITADSAVIFDADAEALLSSGSPTVTAQAISLGDQDAEVRLSSDSPTVSIEAAATPEVEVNVSSGSPSVVAAADKIGAEPIANAGVDQTVMANAIVVLDGSASTTPGGAALEYAWQQLSGYNVTLIGADTVFPSFLAPPQENELILEFELTVTNPAGLTDTDTVQITVQARSAGIDLTGFIKIGEVRGISFPRTGLIGDADYEVALRSRDRTGNTGTAVLAGTVTTEDLLDVFGAEFIFLRNNTGVVPSRPVSSDQDRMTDNYIPPGWTDNPQGVDINNRYEYTSSRTGSPGRWSDFSVAGLYDIFVVAGETEAQFIFRRTGTASAPNTPPSTTFEQANDNYVPFQWSSSPQGTTDALPYEWASYRLRTGGGTWSAFYPPTLREASPTARGPIPFFRAISGSAWSNAQANLATTGDNVTGDRVTLYNSTADWTATRVWDGSDWITIGKWIDGNLIVEGTVLSIFDIIAGAAMRSSNYVAGTDGWRIAQDGDAEFNGLITAERIRALNIQDIIVLARSSSGWLVSSTMSQDITITEPLSNFDTLEFYIRLVSGGGSYGILGVPASLPTTGSAQTFLASFYSDESPNDNERITVRVTRSTNGRSIRIGRQSGGGAYIHVIVGVKFPAGSQPLNPSGGTPPPPGTTVTANAGSNQNVESGGSVQIGGSDTIQNGQGSTTIVWSRVSGTGGSLSSSSIASPTFNAPTVTSNRTIVWRKTVTNNGVTDTDDITITVMLAAVQAPGTPSTPTLSSRTSSSLTLATSAGSGGAPTGYRWRISTNSSVTDSDPMHTSSGASITISGLSEDTNYWVDVRAENSAGESNYSGDRATSTLAGISPPEPDNSFTVTMLSPTKTFNRIDDTNFSGNVPASALLGGVAGTVEYISIWQLGSGSRIGIDTSGLGNRFISAIESGGSFRFSNAGAGSFTIVGGTGGDTTEPYQWFPDNSQEITDFFNDYASGPITVTVSW